MTRSGDTIDTPPAEEQLVDLFAAVTFPDEQASTTSAPAPQALFYDGKVDEGVQAYLHLCLETAVNFVLFYVFSHPRISTTSARASFLATSPGFASNLLQVPNFQIVVPLENARRISFKFFSIGVIFSKTRQVRIPLPKGAFLL